MATSEKLKELKEKLKYKLRERMALETQKKMCVECFGIPQSYVRIKMEVSYIDDAGDLKVLVCDRGISGGAGVVEAIERKIVSSARLIVGYESEIVKIEEARLAQEELSVIELLEQIVKVVGELDT